MPIFGQIEDDECDPDMPMGSDWKNYFGLVRWQLEEDIVSEDETSRPEISDLDGEVISHY